MRLLTMLIRLACLCSFFLLASCKDDCTDPTNPDCENYDPCYGIIETNADFTIEVQIWGADSKNEWFELDQLFHGGRSVRFTPKHDLDSVIWLIGTERLTDRVIIRSNFPRDKTITVTLIGRKKPNPHCSPADNGIDTVTKSFYVHPEAKWIGDFPQDTLQAGKSPILGKYKGALASNPSKEIEIELVNYWKKNGGTYYRFSHIKGLPYANVGIKPFTPLFPNALYYDYDCLIIDDDSRTTNNWNMTGTGYLNKETGNLKLKYTYLDSTTYDPRSSENWVYLTNEFEGYKIN